MTLSKNIEKIFARREMPIQIAEPSLRSHFDSDVADALWFTGRDWRSLSWQDWQGHDSGISYFNQEALAYYLPSILTLSLQHPENCLAAAERIVSLLDVPPSAEYWSPILKAQLVGLRSEEYDLLKEWLLDICKVPTYHLYGSSGAGDNLGRAFDTVDLLQRETALGAKPTSMGSS